MATMGPDGMTQAAEQSMAKAHYLAGKLTALTGVALAYDGAYFQEFVTTMPQRDAVLAALDAQNILGGLPLETTKSCGALPRKSARLNWIKQQPSWRRCWQNETDL